MKTLTKLIALIGLAFGAKIGWEHGGKDMAQNAAYEFAEDKFKGRAQKDQYIAELTQQLKQLTSENEKLQKYQQEAEKKKDSLHRMFGEDNPK